MILKASEDVGKPCERINVVELGGLDQRIDGGGAMAALVRAGEGPVAPPGSHRPHGALGRIVKGHDGCGALAVIRTMYNRSPGSGRRERETVAGRLDHELRTRVVTWPPLRLARLRCERESVDVVHPTGSRSRMEVENAGGWTGYSSIVRASGDFRGWTGHPGSPGRARPRK